jgi:hypothetical protein
MPKQQPNGTPGKNPLAPSVKIRLGRTPLEQRSDSKPLHHRRRAGRLPARRPMRLKPVGILNRFRCVVVSAEPVQGFLAGVRVRDPLNVFDNIILANQKPASADHPASSTLRSKHQPRDPR